MTKTKSGEFWVTWANTHAKNSTEISDLEATFQENVKAFIKALKEADPDINIDIITTKRSKKRAYLFHWSWKIFLEKCTPSEAEAMDGVEIEWDHGDLEKSKTGAGEMVTGFGLAIPPKSTVPPSLTSNHIAGKAIDMNITWTGKIKIKNKDGIEVELTFMDDPNLNTALHQVGESYGVKKLTTDMAHWSYSGR